MQTGFYFDQTRCTGCFTCVVACKDWHDVPAGPASWMRVTTIEKGKYPDVFVAFLATPCYHCLEPACVDACPVNAITKRRKDGIVVVDREACLGRDRCQLCLEACPYEAPQFGAEENAKMQKCDLCLERWAEHKKPICVDACPMRALDAGPIKALKAKYGDSMQAEGFAYSEKMIPSIVFKPKKDAKGLAVQRIEVAPGCRTVS
ncbi:MAG: 4Fe-4S dicluster domain-containing protein [Chloroflexi bacterium]|nr:4Fe-4S dicluster domain-containing protein [Chloroflexota bacterium]